MLVGGGVDLAPALLNSVPSASLTIVVSNRPPTRRSVVMRSSGVLTPVGPQKWVRCSASVMQAKTSSRGASKTRV